MNLFNEIFFESMYKIKLVGMASNIIEKLLIFDIHNELYILKAEFDGMIFEKLNSTKDLYNMLKRYSQFSIGYEELIKQETSDEKIIYKSNLFEIKDNLIYTTNFWSLEENVSKEQLASHASTILFHRDQLFANLNSVF